MTISASNQPTGAWREPRPMLAPSERQGGALSAQTKQVAAAPARNGLPDYTERPLADRFTDQDIDEDTAAVFAERMLAPIGLEYADVQGLLSSETMRRAISELRKALDEQSLDNAHLKSLLREYEEDAKDKIAKSYSEVRRGLNGDPEKNTVASRVEEKLTELGSVLILLPKLDIFHQLIEAMDRKAIDQDAHAPEDLTLLKQLVATRDILLAGNVNTPQTWHDAAEALREPSNSSEDAEVLTFRNTRGKSTGNA